MNDECQRTIYLALYDAVHPLAIVQRGGVICLACMFAPYDDVRTIALHRVRHAELLYEPARARPDFDLDSYIESGQFGVLTGEPVTLRATFSRAAGEHLYETPLSAGQSLVAAEDGSVQLTATVPATRALVWRLLTLDPGGQPAAPKSPSPLRRAHPTDGHS